MRRASWVLVVAPFLVCCGGKGEHNQHDPEDPEALEDPEDQEQPGDQEQPEPLISECREENSEAECETICHLPSKEPVGAECFLVGMPVETPLRCSCEGGPSDGAFFALASCADLQASIASVCAQGAPPPPCPTVVPASGQSCTHSQECWVEEFSGDCSPGEAVRRRSVGVECANGVWRETGVGEEPCP